MFWHVVKFRFAADVTDEQREQCENGVRGMPAEIPLIKFLRLEHSVDEPDVTGLVMGFDDQDGFRAYQEHPLHIPVAHAIDDACSDVVRVDFVTDDDPVRFA